METYGSVSKEVIDTPNGTFWVFDRPDIGKIMTTPSPGTIAGPAFLSGLTLGMVVTDPVLASHQAIAKMWFEKTNRKCEIKTSFEIWRPEYEHTYVCKT
ncbi:hypothetical protein [Pinisolibacter aquiterrae]|uniref:hypothetical protein n=1 Tax=Pinisolibacter aquiterrae TaxID=2815579 RepID=UPI001C3E7FAD|nr:hypothetical protein [Pinisolibacter aquiterrae]MBV5264483.1 hypothetical protein [Pinisolibacter aquiterrae]MCC8234368.1 hypothetical protein [Pinisolibacter aquiterrae]